MEESRGDISVCRDLEQLSRRAAHQWARWADEFVMAKGRFTVALSGGSTPRALYARLAGEPFRDCVPWSKVHLFWGDERCVPPDHGDSNYGMVKEALLSKVPIPPENIHRMPGERKDPVRAAFEYEQTLAEFFNLSRTELPRFDLILLGLGEDGHTASLFPGTVVLHERKRLAAAPYVEKLHTYRLTLTPPVLNHAANILFMVSGEAKATILREVLEGEYQPEQRPAQLIRPTPERLLWMIDRAAASRLRQDLGGES
ncbi:MAG: 6-phosphogluconolactonase [Acidobacteria bacterium]|nr:6-phosphogluconolactonase [Acidobacteriota bacterium]MBI3658517.1 6-phosphogluconolactonase [Acidobacteriota bacterium]